MEEDLIKKLDEVAQKHIYWKRSDIIRNVLIAVFAEMSAGDIYNMIRYAWYKKNVVDAKFEITDELKPYEKK
jgi:metal-responsive CopG/Arc/MetJ family transcriptional regulator